VEYDNILHISHSKIKSLLLQANISADLAEDMITACLLFRREYCVVCYLLFDRRDLQVCDTKWGSFYTLRRYSSIFPLGGGIRSHVVCVSCVDRFVASVPNYGPSTPVLSE
jgi:hypothetical protein